MKHANIWKMSITQWAKFPDDQRIVLPKKSCNGKRSIQSTRRTMDANATEYEKFRAMNSDFPLQLAFKKLLLVEFWCSIKKEYSQCPEKTTKILFSLLTTNLSGSGFSSCTSTKQQNTTAKAEADMRIQLRSLNSPSNKIVKHNVIIPTISVLEVIFH